MSSKPKQSDYKASEAEQINASVAKADKDYFDQNYGPILREERDLSEKENLAGVAAGRANADVAQTLDKPSLAAARSVDAFADRASAGAAQQLQAQFQGLQAKRQRQVGVLGTARGQQAEASTGLAKVARIENTKTLMSAKRKQMTRDANTSAAFKLGGTMLSSGLTNKEESRNFFDGDTSLKEGGERFKNWMLSGSYGGNT